MEEYPLYTGEEGRFRVKVGYTLIGFSAFFFISAVLFPRAFSFVSLLLTPLMVAGIYFIKSGRKLLKGYDGEVRVLKVLSSLGGYVVSDVILPGGRGNIDHVFISRKGIFAIEVKNYDSDVMVEGDVWWILKPGNRVKIGSISRSIKRRALELSRFIEESTGRRVFVVPVIVFAGKGVVIGESTVPVLTPDSLTGFIRNHRESLNEEAVSDIVSVIKEFGHMVLGDCHET